MCVFCICILLPQALMYFALCTLDGCLSFAGEQGYMYCVKARLGCVEARLGCVEAGLGCVEAGLGCESHGLEKSKELAADSTPVQSSCRAWSRAGRVPQLSAARTNPAGIWSSRQTAWRESDG